MRKLFLVRHGESKASEYPGGDAFRQLTDLGIRQIEQLADVLKTQIENIPEIICSDAVRAVTTASIIAKKWDMEPKLESEIYYGGTVHYEKAVNNHSTNDNLILVGHNPDISLFSSGISGSDVRFLPGTCVKILLDSGTEPIKGKLLQVWHPGKN